MDENEMARIFGVEVSDLSPDERWFARVRDRITIIENPAIWMRSFGIPRLTKEENTAILDALNPFAEAHRG